MGESTQKKKPKSSATRAQAVAAARAKETPEERQEKARKAALSGTPEERSARARKAALASAEKRRAAKESQRRRAEAARKGWETRRRENPEKYAPQKRKPTKAQKKSARSAAAKKGWETRRIREAERVELARRYREAEERRRRDWRSELEYVVRAKSGGVAAWVREVLDAAKEDAEAAGAALLGQPWRIVGAIEGADGGAASFDVTLSGTLHDRAAQLAATLVDAAKRGGVYDRDPSPDRQGKSTRPAKGAVALDAAAEEERRKAIEAFAGNVRTVQSARVSTLLAPIESSAWRSQPDEEDNDDIPF